MEGEVDAALVLEHLPSLIKAKRRRDGLTIRQAADLVGVPRSTLGRYEKGEVPSVDLIATVLRWVEELDEGHHSTAHEAAVLREAEKEA